MRKLENNEISQISGGAWWSASNILNLINGADSPATGEDWKSYVTADRNDAGMAGVIGKTVVGIAIVAGVAAAGIFAGIVGRLGSKGTESGASE